MPYAIALKSTPVVALAPLLVIWFGNGLAGKVILASLICFFPILIGLVDGMKSVPVELQRTSKVWGAPKSRRIFLVEFPYSVPYLLSSLKVAGPLAVVGAVVAEFSGADKGLGHIILIAAYQVNTALLFIGIIIVSLYGITLYLLISVIEYYMLRKMRFVKYLN